MTDGLCECGCGKHTKLAAKNDASSGRVKGQPMRYLKGHRSSPYPTGPRGVYKQVRFAVNEDTGCWDWLLYKDEHGYGAMFSDGEKIGAHRFFYESEHGPVAAGIVLHHSCGNHACCNPAHLVPMTRRDHSTMHAQEQRLAVA
jgi:hypothetical protein